MWDQLLLVGLQKLSAAAICTTSCSCLTVLSFGCPKALYCQLAPLQPARLFQNLGMLLGVLDLRALYF